MTTEADINRRNTQVFIDADPTEVILVPQENKRVAGGGRKWTAMEVRETQTMRLIPQNQSGTNVMSPDGIQMTASFVLLGTHDCEMGLWDKFTAHGMDLQIVTTPRRVPMTNAYEVKAEVAML